MMHRTIRSIATAPISTGPKVGVSKLVITRPDDFHLHVREGESLASVVPHTSKDFARALIMPNLKPPVLCAADAIKYKKQIQAAVPTDHKFDALMTCYLTDKTTPEDIHAAKEAGVLAFKLYPAGATTNSDSGVTSMDKVLPTLRTMAEVGMVLCVHGEVTDADVDVFDREGVFIRKILDPLMHKVPGLKVVLEHVTTKDAVDFVTQGGERVAASITPQHILMNRNALFQGGLRPHCYCLPVLKRELHREAVSAAAMSGSPQFFLGTDSAPHPKGAKESACGCAGIYSAPIALALYATAFENEGRLDKLEGFASHYGADFYKLPRNTDTVTLVRRAEGEGAASDAFRIPDEYAFGGSTVVPMWAGQLINWRVEQ